MIIRLLHAGCCSQTSDKLWRVGIIWDLFWFLVFWFVIWVFCVFGALVWIVCGQFNGSWVLRQSINRQGSNHELTSQPKSSFDWFSEKAGVLVILFWLLIPFNFTQKQLLFGADLRGTCFVWDEKHDLTPALIYGDYSLPITIISLTLVKSRCRVVSVAIVQKGREANSCLSICESSFFKVGCSQQNTAGLRTSGILVMVKKIPSEMEVAPPHKRFTQFSTLIKL